MIRHIVLSRLNSDLLDLLLLFLTQSILALIFFRGCFAVIETSLKAWLYRAIKLQPSCVMAAVHYKNACVVECRAVGVIMLDVLL